MTHLTCLGHASWLLEVGGLRLVTDPVFSPTYHDGVFEVYPRRTVDLDRLAPTVIVITHRHPDHFDVPTLHQLGRRFPDARVITSDALIVETCEAFGFRSVECVDADAVVDLAEGVRMRTTASLCSVQEWGVLWDTPDGTVWNLVDSVVRSPADVRQILGDAAHALGVPRLAERPDVAFVRWNPLLQADAAISAEIGFPHSRYAEELANAAATGAGVLIPGACGDRYVGASTWQNASVYPVTETRFREDLAVMAPESEVRASSVGLRMALVEGRLGKGVPWEGLEQVATPDDRFFAPFVIPPITDPAPEGYDDEGALVRIATWCGDVLVPALGQWGSTSAPGIPVSFVLQVVFPQRTVSFTFRVRGATVQVQVGGDIEHDSVVRIAGSVLDDVLTARSHWGRALLGGWMRSANRGVRARPDGRIAQLPLPAFFLYLGLPYEESTDRWVRSTVQRLLADPPSDR